LLLEIGMLAEFGWSLKNAVVDSGSSLRV
jgi:hypothetical protein